jgi:hypothetical protein
LGLTTPIRRSPARLVDDVAAHGAGLALHLGAVYVEELTKAILGSGVIEARGDIYVLTDALAQLHIPATLQDSLMARLDRAPRLREVAQLGSVLGRDVEQGVLFAKEIGAKITAVAVIEPFPSHLLAAEPNQFGDAPIEYKKHAEAHAEKVLDTVSAAAKSAGVICETLHVEHAPDLIHPVHDLDPSASRTSGPRRRSRALRPRNRSRGHHLRLVCSMGSRSTHRHHNWRPTMRSSDRAGCRVLRAECRS